MLALASSLVAGLLFGAGIAISGMINPAKVLNFFDILGSWDPSLGFVMAGALFVTLPGYRLIFTRMDRPMAASSFVLPPTSLIDRKLIGGAAIFGIGWGIAGFCPGGAVPALGLEPVKSVAFLAAGAIGTFVAWALQRQKRQPVDDA